MPRYRVIHQLTGETWEVEAALPDEARQVVGWPEQVCWIRRRDRGPFAEIIPPKVARQITPPKPGSSPICPDCAITMVEKTKTGDFWWQCPGCDLLYHEWENQYFRADQV